METVEDLCVTTPDKRKRLIEFQTSKKSTPEEVSSTTDVVNSLSPTTLNNALHNYNSTNQRVTQKRITNFLKY